MSVPCDERDSQNQSSRHAGHHRKLKAREIEKHRSKQHDDNNGGSDSASNRDSINSDFSISIVVVHAEFSVIGPIGLSR